MPRPQQPAVHVERDDLAVAEPGVHTFTVRDGSWRREIVLLVNTRKRSGGLRSILPQAAAVRALERFNHEPHVVCRVRVCSSAYGLLAIGERRVVPRQLWMRVAGGPRRRADLRCHDYAVSPDDG